MRERMSGPMASAYRVVQDMHRVYGSPLPSLEKSVLLALVALLESEKRAEIRVADIAAYCSLSVRGVQRALADLDGAGLVVRYVSDGHPTVYSLRLERLPVTG